MKSDAKTKQESQQFHPTIVRDDRGLSISGTRITLYDILDYLKQDWPPRLIQYWFELSDQQLVDIMDYIEDHRDAVEAEYGQVLQDVEENQIYWVEQNRELFARITATAVSPDRKIIWDKIVERKARLKQL